MVQRALDPAPRRHPKPDHRLGRLLDGPHRYGAHHAPSIPSHHLKRQTGFIQLACRRLRTISQVDERARGHAFADLVAGLEQPLAGRRAGAVKFLLPGIWPVVREPVMRGAIEARALQVQLTLE